MEIANVPCAEAAAAIELFIRSATVLPRRPAVLVMDARPDQEIKALRAIAARNKRSEAYASVTGVEGREGTLMNNNPSLHARPMNPPTFFEVQ